MAIAIINYKGLPVREVKLDQDFFKPGGGTNLQRREVIIVLKIPLLHKLPPLSVEETLNTLNRRFTSARAYFRENFFGCLKFQTGRM